MSVQRSQASVARGQKAAYTVRVSTENNGSASNVSVALVAQPASQKPTFTSGCPKGNGTATCSVSSVSAKQPAELHAQIPVASTATSVTSVKLTATASIVTSVEVDTAVGRRDRGRHRRAGLVRLPGQVVGRRTGDDAAARAHPEPQQHHESLIGSSSLIGAGNAAGLFPEIVPSASPNSSPAIQAQAGQRNVQPVSESSALGLGKPGLTGQVAGLIALALAIMLTVTRLSLRKRFRSRKQGS